LAWTLARRRGQWMGFDGDDAGEEDSPLVTPEDTSGAAGASRRERERERLLTPDSERRAPVAKGSPVSHDLAPGAAGEKRKADAAGAAGESELRRAESNVGSGAVASGEKYKKVKKVGVGAYGSVFMAENTETGELVAVKVTSRKEDPILGGFPLSLLREIVILQSLKHDNIVQIHEVTQTPTGDPLIVMEYCHASLLELLNSRKHELSFSEVKFIIRQVLDATRHMHERGILHRDLATKNVLFNLSGEIKVCDFGISRRAFAEDEEFGLFSARHLEDPNMIVSLPYRAIELLLGQRSYGPALDVWAAGCILGEILLCQGGRRRTFFGGDAESVNKTPQMVVEEIFSIVGRPTAETWPEFSSLPLWASISSNSAKLDQVPRQEAVGAEKALLRRFFVSGAGKCAYTKYVLPEASFDLLGGLLTLDPSQRVSARDALKHPLFNEKPLPEWHAWHWATASQDIPRGDDMRRQRCSDGNADADVLLRQLSRDDVKKVDDSNKTLKEKAKEAMTARANEKKMLEEKQLAARKAAQDRSSQGAANGEKLPPGWTKHWSSSKQCYYYHDKSTGQNSWKAPKK